MSEAVICARCKKAFVLDWDKTTCNDICGDCADDLRQEQDAEEYGPELAGDK